MRGVDTNVIVRYLMGDDALQAQRARALIGSQPVFVARTVLLEVEWVLRSVYALSPQQVLPALRAFLGLPGVAVEQPDLVATAMDWAEAGMDFADALHLAAAGGCADFLTFDKNFARSGSRLSGMAITTP